MGFNLETVLENFLRIAEIPRESGKEEKIGKFICEYADDLGLYSYQDEFNNVYVKKKGKVEGPAIIIQNHIDMVCEKEKDISFDFSTDKIEVYEDDGWLKAKGTTLGADNGIGVSVALAIMADDEESYPNMNFLFTADEEKGFTGVDNMNPDILNADYVINLDSLPEGYFYCGGAGGFTLNNSIPVECYDIVDTNLEYFKIKVHDLTGGHGHMDVLDGRKSAIFVLYEVFESLRKSAPLMIGSISGGENFTMIPTAAEISFAAKVEDLDSILKIFGRVKNEIKRECSKTDPNLEIRIEKCDKFSKGIRNDTLDKLFAFLDGMSREKPVARSQEDYLMYAANLGEMYIDGQEVKFSSFIGSMSDELMEEKEKQYKDFSSVNGISAEIVEKVKVWKYKDDSELTNLMIASYEDTTGRNGVKTAISTVCECGVVSEKYKGEVDLVSFGFDIEGIHTVKERIRIKSIENVVDSMRAFFRRLTDNHCESIA
jgi:dipeptidase D